MSLLEISPLNREQQPEPALPLSCLLVPRAPASGTKRGGQVPPPHPTPLIQLHLPHAPQPCPVTGAPSCSCEDGWSDGPWRVGGSVLGSRPRGSAQDPGSGDVRGRAEPRPQGPLVGFCPCQLGAAAGQELWPRASVSSAERGCAGARTAALGTAGGRGDTCATGRAARRAEGAGAARRFGTVCHTAPVWQYWAEQWQPGQGWGLVKS